MTWRVLTGDCREVLRSYPAESVQCCITSPPYWGLRDYGTPPLVWGDWIGSLGLERTPEEYVSHIVEVFREVRRVLHRDGTLWLNMGDCYASGAGKVGECPGGGEQGARWAGTGGSRGERTRALRDGRHAGKNTAMSAMGPMTQPNRLPIPGLKAKDLVGIPWRVAFALQADGWWLRSDIIWSKTNPMPENVTDRPTKSHEYLFLLSRSETYFYNMDAIKERTTGRAHHRGKGVNPKARAGKNEDSGDRRRAGFNHRWRVKQNESFSAAVRGLVEYRNKRSVWTFPTRPFKGAHFATFPVNLVEPCILAGSRAGDVVLDPFAGTGTVGVAAVQHSRAFVGLELNHEYVAMAERRISRALPAPMSLPGLEAG